MAGLASYCCSGLLFVAREIQREGYSSAVFSIVHRQVEGDDIGGVVVGELQLDRRIFIVHAIEVTNMGSTVVEIGIGNPVNPIQHTFISTVCLDIIGEGEM